MAQPFSSANPAVDQLFLREFATRQADQAAAEAAAARAIQRQQIQAQSELARAQQESTAQQNQFNNLFRVQSEAERNALFKRQLDIDEKARVPRTDLEAERRKQAIIDANAKAINDANRANALNQINLESALKIAKDNLPSIGQGLFGGTTAADLDNPKHPAHRAIAKQAFEVTSRQLLSEKGDALNSLIPDADTFTFRPVRFDEKGNAVVEPYKAPAGTPNDYDYMGNPINQAGLGVTPAPAAVPAAPDVSGQKAAAAAQVIQPVVNKALSSLADLFRIQAPATVSTVIPSTPSVKRLLGNDTVLLTPADDAELQRQLMAVVPEQRPATYRAIIDQLLRSQRAVLQSLAPGTFEIPSAMY